LKPIDESYFLLIQGDFFYFIERSNQMNRPVNKPARLPMGTKVIVGDKFASLHNYRGIVGEEVKVTNQFTYNSTHDSWHYMTDASYWIRKEDALPIADGKTNKDFACLLEEN
jgi:hypothetical protein